MFASHNSVKRLFSAKPIIIRAVYAALQRNSFAAIISFAVPQGDRVTTDIGFWNCQVMLVRQAFLLRALGDLA